MTPIDLVALYAVTLRPDKKLLSNKFDGCSVRRLHSATGYMVHRRVTDNQLGPIIRGCGRLVWGVFDNLVEAFNS